LELTHVGRYDQNQYYSLYGGYLEDMFAGVGGEWLYRPFASRVAFGVDVNAVQQRNFKQDFGFREAGDQTGYRVATGHATLYWDTGWNCVMANLSVGRYLAKDIGATVQLSRAFQNGVTIGGYFTKTNVSAQTFGEGSFDKGIFVSLPFDAFLTRSSGTTANFVWKPLLRDGGAKLAHTGLYDLTNLRDDRTLSIGAAPTPNHAVMPADRRDAWTPPPKGPEPYSQVAPQPAAETWAAAAQGYEQRLVEALYRQQFRNIRVAYDSSYRLTIALSNASVHPVSRSVGRAARTALRLGPMDMREMRITLALQTDPVVSYEFVDLLRLERYFSGAIGRSELADSVAVEYLNPSVREPDALARLDDRDTDAGTPQLAELLLPERSTVHRFADDMADAGHTAADTNWLRMGVVGTGLVLASIALDRRVNQFAQDHSGNKWLKGVNKIGNNIIPWLAIGGAAAAAIDGSDPARSRIGYAAMESGGTAFLAVTALKSVFGRARPENNLGNHTFKPFTKTAGYDSMPSGHTIITWAVATPFAEQYDMPWLYGVAAVTNLARVGSRAHWVSDTVAGSLLGYGIGKVFWESSRSPKKGEPRVMVHPSGVNLAWELH
jgi:membrane-associated phospholipid phosphatase